jgi:hypothetical protein
MATSEKADAIARLLTRDPDDAEQLTAATEVAQAQLELLRIRAARANLMAGMDLTSGTSSVCVGYWPWTATNATHTPSGDGLQQNSEMSAQENSEGSRQNANFGFSLARPFRTSRRSAVEKPSRTILGSQILSA